MFMLVMNAALNFDHLQAGLRPPATRTGGNAAAPGDDDDTNNNH
jgi:hypothetical protein